MDSWENIPEMTESINVPTGLLEKFSKDFRANAKNILAMNAISRNDMTNVVVNRDCLLDTYHIFSDRLETEAKVANQKSSGRCWLFAATNILRLNVMKKYNLEEFEFSQAYLFWCDKLEKGNWFLENVLNTLDEELDGRLVQFILKDPVQDGGQWDMVVNLIEKFGLMPKGVFAESAHSGNSARLNWLITVKLREFACQLRGMHEKGQPLKELRTTKEKMLSEIYNIVTISLGEPPQTFEWSFRNKDKKFQSFKNLTPLTFYQEHVGEPIGDLVSLINDPRHEYEMLYTVQYLGNVAGGRPVLYLNLKIEELKKHTIDAIQSGKAVWFGCDVGKFSGRQAGIMDLDMFDYKSAYGVDFGLDKADRLRYGESLMTHAMAITGVHLDEGKPVRWRIENSWGEDGGEKGYFSMTDAWFSEYVYQVVIDKKVLSKEQQKVLKGTPIRLSPWVLNRTHPFYLIYRIPSALSPKICKNSNKFLNRMREQNFAKLFRHSKFAQFDTKIPRVYESSTIFPSAPVAGGETVRRPTFFGFKRDLHPTHYGRSLKYVQMEQLDGHYGQCTVRNAQDMVRQQQVIGELQRLLGTGSNQSGPNVRNFSGRPALFQNGVLIPGRVLNSLEGGGYAIGIGGIVAELPLAEIPAMVHFTQNDITNRRAFYFYVLRAEFDAKGIPHITLSLRRQ